MHADATNAFVANHRGPVIRPGDATYDEARRLYNGMIDKKPLLIAQCADVADVIAAVNFGREQKLPLAIRGGGHNGPGFASVDEGMVIDMSRMRGVRVDPATRTVRVEAGCTTGDVDHATYAFGQAVPFGIVSTTGVAGLTLSGGHGYLSRQYGLAIDSLIEADVVLADGSFVTASETQNPDLLWALRGGGGNFGVVTSFLFRMHPARDLYAGPIIFDISDAPTVMKWYRAFQSSSADDFYIWLGLQTVVPSAPFPEEHWNKKMCVLLVAHNGRDGEADVNKLRASLPKPIIDWCGPMPYPALQSMFDLLYPKGLHWYWKGDFVRELSDAAIAEHLKHAAEVPTPLSAMHLYPINGAVHRKQPGDAAWNARDATWSMVIVGVTGDPAQAPATRQWARDYWGAMHPFDLKGAYPNFMMADEGAERIAATYGGNYQRLAQLKKKFDPGNLFRINQNIEPAA